MNLQIIKITGSSVFFVDLASGKETRKKKVDFNKLYVPEGKMLPTSAQKKATPKAPKPTPQSAPVKKGPGKSLDSVLKYYQDEFKDVVLESINSNRTFFNKGDNYTLRISRHTTKSFGVFFLNATMQEFGLRYNNSEFKQKAQEFLNTAFWEFSTKRTGKVKLQDIANIPSPSQKTSTTKQDETFNRFRNGVDGKVFELVRNVDELETVFVGNGYMFKNIEFDKNTNDLTFDVYTDDSDSYCFSSIYKIDDIRYQVSKIQSKDKFVIWAKIKSNPAYSPIGNSKSYKLVFTEDFIPGRNKTQPKAQPEPVKKGPRKKFPEPKREPFNKKTDYFKLFKTYLGEGAKELTPSDVATKTNLTYLEIAESSTKEK